MFLYNNDRINFSELERRVSWEIAKLPPSPSSSSRPVAPWQDVPGLDPEVQLVGAAGDIDMTGEPTIRRSLRSRVSVWVWGVLHIRVVLRRAIAGVYAAEGAKERVGKLEDRVRAFFSQEERRSALQEIAIATCKTTIEDLREQVDTLTTMSERLATEARALSERLATDAHALSEQLLAVRGEVMFQQRRLTNLVTPAAAKSADEAAADVLNQRFDSFYVAFQDIFRGRREDLKANLLPYVDRLLLTGAGQRHKPIVDIGCGSGEWLEVLKEKGLHAYGVDVNTVMVERSVSLGLDARLADAMVHLRGIEDASCSALTAFQVVEHLPFATVADLLDEAFRVVIPGGVLILETPNPETMRVGATTFYYDPTHRNPLMPGMLELLVRHRGFVEVEILRLHPFTQGLLQEKTADAEILNRVLFGSQDYAIIARRP